MMEQIEQLTSEEIDMLWSIEVEKEKEYWEIVYDSGEWAVK